jgi:hypothetical protein
MVKPTNPAPHTPSTQADGPPATCELCGQPLAGKHVLAPYQLNRSRQEAQLVKKIRDEIRTEVREEYRAKTLAEAQRNREKAEATVRRDYEHRFWFHGARFRR